MKAKVINDDIGNYGVIFKVRRMNFDKIIVNYPTDSGIKSFEFTDMELIAENKIDEFLIKNRDFLKIKLRRGISVFFYNALYDSIKFEIKEEIKTLSVLKEKYKINKRGIWDKEILLIINKEFPLEAIASGQNFKKDGYNIVINKIEKENFLEICYAEIANIESEIKLKKNAISTIISAINQFEVTYKMPEELLL